MDIRGTLLVTWGFLLARLLIACETESTTLTRDQLKSTATAEGATTETATEAATGAEASTAAQTAVLSSSSAGASSSSSSDSTGNAPREEGPTETTIEKKPAALSNSSLAVFTFASNKSQVSYVCKIDNEDEQDCSKHIAYADLADGEHQLSVYAVDAWAVADETPEVYAWQVDATAPTSPLLQINAGARYTNSSAVTLSLQAVGATKMRFGASADLSALAWVDYASSASFDLSEGEGAKLVYAEFADDAGNRSAVASARIELDSEAPSAAALSINSGAAYTNSKSVDLSLFASNASQMQLTDDGSFEGKTWVPYAETVTWLLSGSDCTVLDCKSVRARFRDDAGNVTAAVEDSITLDRVSPTTPQITTQAQVKDTTSTSGVFTITIAAASSDDFFARYEVIGDSTSMTAFRTITPVVSSSPPSFEVTLTSDRENRLRLRAVDEAGNVSPESEVIITEDRTAPAAPTYVRFYSGADRVRLVWDASASTDVAYYEIAYDRSGHASTNVPSGNGVFATEGNSPIRVGSALSYTLSGIGSSYSGFDSTSLYVMVRAVDHAGHRSADPGGRGYNSAKIWPGAVTPALAREYHPDSSGYPSASAMHGDIMVVAERCTYSTSATPTLGAINPDRNCSASDGSVRIYSLADTSSPTLLARCSSASGQACGLATPISDAHDVSFDGQYAYIAAGALGVVVLDLSDPLVPVAMGTCAHDGSCLPSNGFARALAVQAGMIYVADGPAGLRTLEAHDPASISSDQLMRCTTTRSAGCTTSALSNGSPHFDNDSELAFHALTSGEYDESVAFVANGTSNVRCEATDVLVSGAYLFLQVGGRRSDWCGLAKVKLLKLVDDASDSTADDAGDPSAFAPTFATVVRSIDAGAPGGMALSGGVFFMGANNRLLAYDLATLVTTSAAAAKMIDQPAYNIRSLALTGPLLVAASQPASGLVDALSFYDLKNLRSYTAGGSNQTLAQVGAFGDAGPNQSPSAWMPVRVRAFGSTLLLSSGVPTGKRTTAIIDLATPWAPEPVNLSSAPTLAKDPSNMSVQTHGRYVFINDETSMKAFDMSNEEAPFEISLGTIDPTGGRSFAVRWPYLYTLGCDSTNVYKLRVYDMSYPASVGSPVLRSQTTIPQTGILCDPAGGHDTEYAAYDHYSAMSLHGRMALVGGGSNGLYVLNVSNPANPYFVLDDGAGNGAPVTGLGGKVHAVAARAGSAYVGSAGCYAGCGPIGIKAISLPSNPTTSGTDATIYTTLSSVTVSAATNVQSPLLAMEVWGGHLFATFSATSASVFGYTPTSSPSASQLGQPVGLTEVYALPRIGKGLSRNGRYLLDFAAGYLTVIDAGRGGGGTFNVVATALGNTNTMDFTDGAAFGPYQVLVGAAGLTVFDLMLH